ncbi:MAG TPA: flagellar M-ring protein FliF C-terminal domain-containing protein [Candidatus Rubrimentiphilum sp.]|nr:flagellar M-ring protein FliF C-terminal domain-containing protein [Candidatus Rubrimentiphilum sp.]
MHAAALIDAWNRLPRGARPAALSVLAIVVVISIVWAVATHSQQVPLFSSALHAEQLSEIEERLAGWNVPFTPVTDNILVQASRRSDLLLRLSLAGVPHAHVESSSDLLGKVGALTPQSVIDAQARDGLADDIQLALRGIDGIADAKIIVAPAKAAYFADETAHDASASVRLRLQPGTRLSSNAVDGIRSFVAASVAGLDSRRVTIVDDRGIALGDSAESGDANDLQSSLQSALDAAVGAGATIVRVHVDYDRRSLQSSVERRLPSGSSAIGGTLQRERYDGGGKHYERSEQQLDRGSETRQFSATSAGARISRITAAVFVDAARGADLYQVRTLAAAALGIDPHRGDSLEVGTIAFARAAVPRKDGWWLAYGAIVPLLPALVSALAVLVALRWSIPAFGALLRPILERSRIARGAAAVSGIPPAKVRGALKDEPPHAAAAIISALPASTAAAVLDMYPPEERSAIVRRMQRPLSPLLTDPESFIARA